MDTASGDVFLSVNSSLGFAEAAPRFLQPHDVLLKMIALAKAEISHRVITSRLPQSTNQLAEFAMALARGKPDGAQVWRAIALVQYLSTSKVGETILAEFGITRFCLAVVQSVASFARFVVSNRARREHANMSTSAKQVAADAIEAVEKAAAEEECTGSGVDLATASVAAAVARRKVMSRKMQRHASSSTTQLIMRSSDDDGIYTGSGLVTLIDFFACCLQSPQAAFLKLLVSEASSVSITAGTEVLAWQVKDDAQELNETCDRDETELEVGEHVLTSSKNVAVSLRSMMLRVLLQTANHSPCITRRRLRRLGVVGAVGGGGADGADGAESGEQTVTFLESKKTNTPLCGQENRDSPRMVTVCRMAVETSNLKVAWCKKTSECDSPGGVEALLYESHLRRQLEKGTLGGRGHRIHGFAEQTKRERLAAPLQSEVTGVARSILYTNAVFSITESMADAINGIVKQLDSTSHLPESPPAQSSSMVDSESSVAVSQKELTNLCEPKHIDSSAFAVGM
ncbi:hypothetical protein N9S81_00540, partial [bacterium]|nr:hypothetical protein [bacterium]